MKWLRAWRRRRDDRDPLVRAWADFYAGRPTHGGRHRKPPPPPARPLGPIPGPLYTVNARVMACYDRLWQRALIVAERKLHQAVLP